MKLRCNCGARIEFPVGSSLKESDSQALKFWEKHAKCRESVLTQSKALQDIAATLQNIFILFQLRKAVKLKRDELVDLMPGEILETIDAPDYTEVLNKIAKNLGNIESNTRFKWKGGPR